MQQLPVPWIQMVELERDSHAGNVTTNNSDDANVFATQLNHQAAEAFQFGSPRAANQESAITEINQLATETGGRPDKAYPNLMCCPEPLGFSVRHLSCTILSPAGRV